MESNPSETSLALSDENHNVIRGLRQMPIKRVFLLVLLLALLILLNGCSSSNTQVQTGGLTLNIIYPSPLGSNEQQPVRINTEDLSSNEFTLSVELNDGDGETIERTLSVEEGSNSSAIHIEDINSGNWDLVATVRDSSNEVVYSGYTPAVVVAGDNTITDLIVERKIYFSIKPVAVFNFADQVEVDLAQLTNLPWSGSELGWVKWGSINLRFSMVDRVLVETGTETSAGGRGGIYKEYNYKDTNMPRDFEFSIDVKAPDYVNAKGGNDENYIGVNFRTSYTYREHRYKFMWSQYGKSLWYEDYHEGSADRNIYWDSEGYETDKKEWHTIGVEVTTEKNNQGDMESKIKISIDGNYIQRSVDDTDDGVDNPVTYDYFVEKPVYGHFGPYVNNCTGAQFRNFSYKIYDKIRIEGDKIYGSIDLNDESGKVQVGDRTYKQVMQSYIDKWREDNDMPEIDSISYLFEINKKELKLEEPINGDQYIWVSKI